MIALALPPHDAGHVQPGSVAPNGAEAYAVHCSACHGPGLGGGIAPSVGPPLSGGAFNAKWDENSAAVLLNYITTKMPLNQPGSLDSVTYAAITDFIRSSNHWPDHESGESPANAPQNIEVDEPSQGEENDDAYYRAIRRRLDALVTVTTPVTDALLQNPSDKDWLTWRRTQSSHGFSPLHQIDRGNVGRLTLAWSLSLTPGTNGIAPLVHDGVMFINSTGTIQALDASNGDVIWEYARMTATRRVPETPERCMDRYGG